MILCREAVVDGPGSSGGDKGEDGMVELDAVLKLQTKRKPASLMNGTGIRLVDNRVSSPFLHTSTKTSFG